MGTSMGKSMRFAADTIRTSGRTSRGVIAMTLQDQDSIADMNVLSGADDLDQYVLIVTNKGYGKLVAIDQFRTQARAGYGVISMKFRSSSGKAKREETDDSVSCFRIVHRDDEVLLITANGIIVRQKVAAIPIQGRAATGVRLQKLDSGDSITSVSIVPKYEEQYGDDVADEDRQETALP
jgi:DNA gyrase subunit A